MKIKINNREFCFNTQLTVLEAAQKAGFEIPSFCNYQDIVTEGNCGICLAKVNGSLQKTCKLPICDDMEIITYDAEIFEARKEALEAIIRKHNGDCTTCFKSTQCRLQSYAYAYGCEAESGTELQTREQNHENKFFIYDANRCIHCLRCVETCKQLQGVGALADEDGHIVFKEDYLYDEYSCVSCGNCLQACPVGALIPKSAQYNELHGESVLTTCPYCGVGCQLHIYHANGKVIGIRGASGVNEELTCVKGRFAFHFINHADRLKTPYIRRNGKLTACSWDEAYTAIAEALQAAKALGPQAVAGLSSARCTNEENYLFQKFIRIAGQTNNVDHCARLCHASTVAGLAKSFGSGAMTNSINEACETEVFLVTGSNTTETHPVIGAKIRQAIQKGAKLIVAEPRHIDLCRDAELFLQIRPGTNVALFNGMMKAIVEESAWNKAFIEQHCEGAEEFFAGLMAVSVAECADICGIQENDLRKAAMLFATAKTAAIYYSMGVTQHSTGTDGVMSVANLAMLTGQIGRKGCGVNPLRGQNNVQGSCDMGALPGDYTGYQKTAAPSVKAKFEQAWNAILPSNTGLTSMEMIDAMDREELKFLYIMGENPLVSDADLNHTQQAFQKGCFIVVQDIFMTETAAYASVVLPAASFAEKSGTFTSTERKVQLIRPVIPLQGESKPDWQIICELAQKIGIAGFDFTSTDAIMNEIAALTPSYGGISHARLEQDGLHWPCPNQEHPGTPMLHKDGNFARGKGLLSFRPYRASMDCIDEEYPLLLTTGRILYQYHTTTMTAKTPAINQIAGENFVEICSETANKYHLQDGEWAKVTSPRGTVQAKIRITEKIAAGVLFMPFHFAANPANRLTASHLDAVAKIPEFKVNKVKIERVNDN